VSKTSQVAVEQWGGLIGTARANLLGRKISRTLFCIALVDRDGETNSFHLDYERVRCISFKLESTAAYSLSRTCKMSKDNSSKCQRASVGCDRPPLLFGEQQGGFRSAHRTATLFQTTMANLIQSIATTKRNKL
jgi:hypothetical protein